MKKDSLKLYSIIIKIGLFVFSILVAMSGLGIYVSGKVIHRNHVIFNLKGNEKIFFLVIHIVIALFIVYKAKTFSFPKSEERTHLKCPKCLFCNEYSVGSGKNIKLCPECGSTLEPLKGFYKRHPEIENI